MNKYKIETVNVPLIFGQKVIGHGVRHTRTHEDIGERIGPFLTGYEAARSIGSKYLNNIANVLKGSVPTIGGYRFYYEGEKEFVIKSPNVEYFKQKDLLLKEKVISANTIENNLKILGLKNIAIIEFKNSASKVSFKCCNVTCNNNHEMRYTSIINGHQRLACLACSNVIASKNKAKRNGLKTFEGEYPQFKKYYHAEDNNGLKMNDISFGATTELILRCDVCHVKQEPKQANAFNKNYEYKFSCFNCNSAGVKYPHLIKEWDNKKNSKTLFDYAPTSDEKVYWICKAGHYYFESVLVRTETAECSRCLRLKKSAPMVQLINKALLDLQVGTFNTLNVEAAIKGTAYRNDFVINDKIAIEYQGSLYHYHDHPSFENKTDKIKFKTNRDNGQFVILLNDFDYGSTPQQNYELVKFSILHFMNYMKDKNFAVGCDIEYNRMKTAYSLKKKKAFYVNLFNRHQRKIKTANLYPPAMRAANYQNDNEIY